jgi:hypothetical protein
MSTRGLNNIMNNVFDILIQMVKIGVSFIMDKWEEVKSVYFVKHEQTKEFNGIWNGGNTISKSFIKDESSDEITKTPYDESDFPKENIVMNYDGIMEEIEE